MSALPRPRDPFAALAPGRRQPAPRSLAGPRPLRAALLCLALAPPTAPQELAELPPSPAARAWAQVAPDTLPATGTPGGPAEDPFAAWPARGAPAWDEPAPWRRWSALVRALAEERGHAPTSATEPPPPSALRASLALCALAQERFDDAWTHFAAVGDGPTLARLLPCFLPGAPAGQPALAGGRPAALAAGVRLAPALPPESEGTSVFGAREMRSAPFVVGDATLAMRVYFEPGDGVQVDLEHLGGGPAELAVRLPHPLDFALGRLYSDWDEVAGADGQVAVRLSAEQPAVSLWANHVGLPPSFPRVLPAELPPGFRRAGVRVSGDAGPRLLRLAEALAELCGLPLAPGAPDAAGSPVDRALAPLVLGPASDPHWAALVSALERFLLQRTPQATAPGPPGREGPAEPAEKAADSGSDH